MNKKYKISYSVISKLNNSNIIYDEIIDIFSPNTTPKSIRKLGGDFRVNTIETFLKNNDLILRSEIINKCISKRT